MTPRTYILTPPGHPDCKISPGPWIMDEHGAIFDTNKRFVVDNLSGIATNNLEQDNANTTHITECMSEFPAWLGWALHIWRADYLPNAHLKVFTDHKGFDEWSIQGGTVQRPIKVQREALAWLLRAGCAREITEEPK